MLPSGNDAAESLAMYFGSLILSKGSQDPNVSLLDISDLQIKNRIEAYQKGTYPPKINENETPQ